MQETLGHVDLLLVLSRHRLWEGSFEVAGKQLTAKALKKTAEEEARGRDLPKHTGFLYCKYSQ